MEILFKAGDILQLRKADHGDENFAYLVKRDAF